MAPSPSSSPPPGAWRGISKDCVLELDDGWKLLLGDINFRVRKVIRRGTVTVRATVQGCPPSNDLKGRTVVVKWSWAPKTRPREADVVENARQHAVQNGRPEMLNHLPTIYHSQDFDDLIPECQEILHTDSSDAYEERVLRVSVREELKPITKLQNAGELAKAFREIFECYRWLHDDVKTIHRDISIDNFMFHEVNGTVYGVLDDFDLAVQLNDESRSTFRQCSGTKLYKAIDLLVPNPPLHLCRHDLESFLYVLVFLTCQIDDSPLADWKNLTMENLKIRKTAAITNHGFPASKAHFQQLRVWIVGISDLFRIGISNRRGHDNKVEMATLMEKPLPSFEDKTFGGAVNFDKFQAELESFIIPS